MPSLPNFLHQSFAEAQRKGNAMAKMETLKLEVDAEQFREDLKTMVDELVERAASRLDDFGVKADLSRVRLDDGDILVVKSDRPLTAETGERIKQYVRAAVERVAPDAEVVVTDGELDLSVIKRADISHQVRMIVQEEMGKVATDEYRQRFDETEASIARGARTAGARFKL